jgi:hypothetical protein
MAYSTHNTAISALDEATEALKGALVQLLREELLTGTLCVGEDAADPAEVTRVSIAEERQAAGTDVIA